jgi:5-hydroxyisourate hydrolase
MGRLTTHVLDLTRGLPASGMEIEVARLGADGARTVVATAATGPDGRTSQPLLEGDALVAGHYELVFAVGDYFGTPPAERFLDRVSVSFGVADPAAHLHVPLLVTPFAYSTYRGS